MQMRVGRRTEFSGATFRKEPLAEVTILADITEKIRTGTLSEKLGAIADLSIKMDEGKAPIRESVLILDEALRDEAKWVKWNAVLVLAKHGSEVLPGLCNGLGNDDLRIRSMSAAMISCIVPNNSNVFISGGREEAGMLRQLFISLADEQTTVREMVFSTLLEIAKRNPLAVLAHPNSEMDNSDLRLLFSLQTIQSTALESVSAQGKRNSC